MTDEEFARLYPNVKWPKTFESKRATRVVPLEPSKSMGRFLASPITEDAIPPSSRGSLIPRVPTSRERMFDWINSTFYGDGGVGTTGNTHSQRLTNFLDFTPVGTLHEINETGRALGEGRLDDAQQSAAFTVLPGVKKARGTRLFGWKKEPQRSLPEEYPNAAKVPPLKLFRPKPKPQRPFHLDYSKRRKLKVNEYGQLTHDIDGREMGEPYVIAGRVWPGEPDRSLMPIDIQRVGEYSIRGGVEEVPSTQLGPGNLGETHFFLGRPSRIKVLDSLSKDEKDMVIAHEVGHVIDRLANEIPTEGIEDELDFVYSASRTGEERTHNLVRPEDFGYTAEMAKREKVAEAVNAYMADPNYFKTVAPKAAARIRKYVARSKELSRIIRFNSLVAGGTVAAGLTGQSPDAEADEKPLQHDSRANVASGAMEGGTDIHGMNRLKEAIIRRGLFPQAPKSKVSTPLVRALMDREARRGLPSYGGPR